MNSLDSDKSIISEWWKEIDKWLLLAFVILISSGFLLTFTISPNYSNDFNGNLLSILSNQSVYLLLGIFVTISISIFNLEKIKLFSIIFFFFFLLLLILTVFIGYELKGSQRWLDLKYITIMPIEFVKPFFCIFLAKILENQSGNENFYKYSLSFIVYLAIVITLIIQPDISQLFLISCIFFASIFISGFSFWILCSVTCIGLIGFISIYLFNFNVKNRVDSFFVPDGVNSYQSDYALNVINSGGLFGVGPGNGRLKNNLPEAHTDYIYSVIAEEFGLLGCSLLLGIFLFIAFRVFRRIYNEKNHFLQLSLFSLIIYFSLQALIHIAVNIRLIPSTGMTLPFISYGGSSVIGISITFGLIMLLSKK